MQQLASRILIVVVLFTLAVTGILIARSRTVRTGAVAPPPSQADLSIKDVELEEQSGEVRWRLTADQAVVFEHEGRTTLKNVAVRVDERGRSWTLRGEEGDLFKREKNIELRGNVVVTSSDGLTVRTSVLRWHDASRRLSTDAPVTLTRKGSVVNGSGLEVQMGDDTATVRGRVRARFGARSAG